jgi:hypothetical protein
LCWRPLYENSMFIKTLDEVFKKLCQNISKCAFEKKTFSYLKWPSHNVLSPKCMLPTNKFFSYKISQLFNILLTFWYILLLGQTWFWNQTTCFNHVLVSIMTWLNSVVENMTKDNITRLKLSQSIKMFQVMDVMWQVSCKTRLQNHF